jgi:chromosome segregation ATPase
MTKTEKPSDLSEAAMALDHELRRFEDLAGQAAKIKLNTEKNLERATEALSRAAESQDRINTQVQKLVAAVSHARQKQESDAAALMARAQEIAARRAQFAQVLQRMGGLGQMAKEVQELLREGNPKLDEVLARMQKVADDAADIGKSAQDQEMEDLARQAEVLRQQVLAARNKVGLLSKKPQS